ncbi:hypothetical protein ACFO0N_22020 [Halobium salinum]|uniref:Uncharacterized protein n=1 Tax=Halobium salinum TaxID=1364940 RepID=A0ABD5PIA3_9EURY|nr:hypothetical protein [Halobium salinum]
MVDVAEGDADPAMKLTEAGTLLVGIADAEAVVYEKLEAAV